MKNSNHDIFATQQHDQIELKARQRKSALSVALTLQPSGMGTIVLVQSFSGVKLCTKMAEKVEQHVCEGHHQHFKKWSVLISKNGQCSTQNFRLIYVISIERQLSLHHKH